MCALPSPSGRSESITLYFIPSHLPLSRLSYNSTSSTDTHTTFNREPGTSTALWTDREGIYLGVCVFNEKFLLLDWTEVLTTPFFLLSGPS